MAGIKRRRTKDPQKGQVVGQASWGGEKYIVLVGRGILIEKGNEKMEHLVDSAGTCSMGTLE